ncbi:hypothetical protein HRbin15_00519 [bacterium HR15]|nr:hypothetical protein HRbin15_00519 [bacterium HR15]
MSPFRCVVFAWGWHRSLFSVMGLCLLLACGSAQRFNWLGPIEVRAVSNAGLVAGKGSNDTGGVRAVRAHRRLGAELQGTLGGNHSEAWGITGNGLTGVGFSTLSNGALRAYRQQPLGGLQNLGVLAGNTDDPFYWSEARDVSADGKTVVGRSIDAQGLLRAFRWSEADGMQDLGTLGGFHSGAYGVSADGSTIVGYADDAQGRMRPFRWTQAGGMHDLGTFGGSIGDAWATSADGQIVVGAAQNAQGQWRAFRWTPAGGLQALPGLGGAESGVRDISADGKVMVGLARNAQGQWRAVRWTASGVEDLTQAYASLIGQGSYLEVAQGVSANGRYIVGQGYNAATQRTEAYILETEPPKPGRIRFIANDAPIPRGIAASISWDGRVVVGGYGADSNVPRLLFDLSYFIRGYAFRWTPTGGLQVIAQHATALSVSPRGTNIVGICRREGTVNKTDAFVWTEQGGFQRYPHLTSGLVRRDPTVYLVVARDDNEAATVAVDPVPPYNPCPALGIVEGVFEFNDGGGHQYCSPLYPLPLYWYGTAPQQSYGNPRLLGLDIQCGAPFIVPTDGTVGLYIGYDFSARSYIVTRELPGIGSTFAFSASAVGPYWGSIIVGASGSHAVRWVNRGDELQSLGKLPNYDLYPFAAYGVSEDGRVIVGVCGDSDFTSHNSVYAFRWTESDGMEDLQDTYGYLLAGTDYILREAKAVSYDGRYIIGMASTSPLNFPQALYWLDTWREGDTNGDGCVDDADLLRVLFAFGTEGTEEPTYHIPLRHEDINYDGIVDDADLLLVLFNFGSGC